MHGSMSLKNVQLHVSALDNGHLQVAHYGHYQAPKHVAVPYVENTLYLTNKYSCVRPVHTLHFMSDRYTHCTAVRPVHTLYIMLDRYTHCTLCQTGTHTVH